MTEIVDDDEDDDLEILDKNENKLEMFWYLEKGVVKSAKDVPVQFQQPGNPSPQLDCSVGGLYYKIYAEGTFYQKIVEN